MGEALLLMRPLQIRKCGVGRKGHRLNFTSCRVNVR